jgi:hypothetical protein
VPHPIAARHARASNRRAFPGTHYSSQGARGTTDCDRHARSCRARRGHWDRRHFRGIHRRGLIEAVNRACTRSPCGPTSADHRRGLIEASSSAVFVCRSATRFRGITAAASLKRDLQPGAANTNGTSAASPQLKMRRASRRTSGARSLTAEKGRVMKSEEKMDRTTKFLLAAIAAGLFANAGANLMRPAQAQTRRRPMATFTQSCRR